MDPSPPGVITVARRYNDFKWLRSILLKAFPGLFVPPLPPANVIGRFENSFIEERRQDLERYIYFYCDFAFYLIIFLMYNKYIIIYIHALY